MTNSTKLKELLEKKEIECNLKIKKLKKTYNIIKIISVSTSILSILISACIAITVLPPLATTLLSVFSGVLVGINMRFKFANKKLEIRQMIDKLNKIQLKLEYVNSKNGDLTEEEYNEIFKEFNTVL